MVDIIPISSQPFVINTLEDAEKKLRSFRNAPCSSEVVIEKLPLTSKAIEQYLLHSDLQILVIARVEELNPFSGKKVCNLLRVVRLNFSKLTTLPHNFIQIFPNIEILDVSNNQLKTLSDAIGYLPKLRELNLSNNCLEKLPESIGKLSTLQQLEVCNNQLKGLPSTIGQLVNLQRLDLLENPLSNSFPSIKGLSNLQSLLLKAPRVNDLARLLNPDSITLGVLSIPDELHDLKELTRLECLHSNLCSANLHRLEHLQVLNLSGCTRFKLQIGQLKHLQVLNLSGCRNFELSEFTELLSLKTLNLEKTGIVPASISNLISLEELNLNSNYNLTQIPPAVCNLSSLTKLSLNGCGLQSISQHLTRLRNLTYLDVKITTDGSGLRRLNKQAKNLNNLAKVLSGLHTILYNPRLFDSNPDLRDDMDMLLRDRRDSMVRGNSNLKLQSELQETQEIPLTVMSNWINTKGLNFGCVSRSASKLQIRGISIDISQDDAEVITMDSSLTPESEKKFKVSIDQDGTVDFKQFPNAPRQRGGRDSVINWSRELATPGRAIQVGFEASGVGYQSVRCFLEPCFYVVLISNKKQWRIVQQKLLLNESQREFRIRLPKNAQKLKLIIQIEDFSHINGVIASKARESNSLSASANSDMDVKVEPSTPASSTSPFISLQQAESIGSQSSRSLPNQETTEELELADTPSSLVKFDSASNSPIGFDSTTDSSEIEEEGENHTPLAPPAPAYFSPYHHSDSNSSIEKSNYNQAVVSLDHESGEEEEEVPPPPPLPIELLQGFKSVESNSVKIGQKRKRKDESIVPEIKTKKIKTTNGS